MFVNFPMADELYMPFFVLSGTNRYFRKIAARFNVETSFVDMTNPENVKNAIKPNTRVSRLWTL